MIDFFSKAPLWIFAICLLGAVATWLAADQFREQILGDTHKLVRAVALRYLQFMIGLFSLFVLGMVLSLGGFFSRSIQALGLTPEPVSTGTALSVEGDETLLLAMSATPTLAEEARPRPGDSSTSTVDPTLVAVKTATIGNTNGAGVNLRAEPGLQGRVVVVVPEGDTVTVKEDTFSADGFIWYLVVTQAGQQGWVANNFLVFGGQ